MTAAVYAVFFLSGVSALAFETLWFHQAGLALGNGVWASSLVLAGFMGGLALGNALAGALGERVRRVLPLYAALEVAIAVTGVGIVYLLPSVGVAAASGLGGLSEQAWLLGLARLAIAFGVLLVPSTAMGATLPLLATELTRGCGDFGAVLGRLYGWNTLGAVAGALGAELVLIGALGIHGAALVAAALNLLAAAGAAGVAMRQGAPSAALDTARATRPEGPGLDPADRADAAGEPDRASGSSGGLALPPPARPWLVAAFISGLLLLALEVVWFRLLSFYVLGETTAFAIMLAVVLASIAAGALAASLALRHRPETHGLAPALAFLSGLGCVISYAVSPSVAPVPGSQLLDAGPEIAQLAIAVMLPVSCFSGAFFVMAGAALRSELRSSSGTAGALALANTAGASLGPLVAGFALIPALGMEGAFFGIALCYGAVGAALLLRARGGPLSYALAVGCGLALALFPFGALETRHVPSVVERFVPAAYGHVERVREGASETVIYVDRQLLGEHLSYSMLTNGFAMSGTSSRSRRYMKLYVYLAQAVHPRLRDALLISYGVGSTAKALTDTRDLERIDVVDTSRDILELSEIVFPDPTEHPLRDPRVRVRVEDGRFHLQTTRRSYDLITGEPPPPAYAGIVNLYTREYFELLYERLNPGGIVTYWLPLHGLSEGAARSVVRAFCQAFEDCSLWQGSGASLMLVGTRGARGGVSAEHFAAQWADPVVGPELRALGFERAEQLGALFVGDAEYLERLAGGAPPLVDDRPKRVAPAPPELDAVWRTYVAWAGDMPAAADRFRDSPLIERLWPGELREATRPYFEYQGILNAFSRRRARELDVPAAHRILSETDLRVPALWALGSSDDFQRMLERVDSRKLEHPVFQAHLAIGRLVDGELEAALDSLERAEAHPALRRDVFRLRIYALARAGELDRARSLAQERYASLGGRPELAPYWRWMIETFGVDPRLMTAQVD